MEIINFFSIKCSIFIFICIYFSLIINALHIETSLNSHKILTIDESIKGRKINPSEKISELNSINKKYNKNNPIYFSRKLYENNGRYKDWKNNNNYSQTELDNNINKKETNFLQGDERIFPMNISRNDNKYVIAHSLIKSKIIKFI